MKYQVFPFGCAVTLVLAGCGGDSISPPPPPPPGPIVARIDLAPTSAVLAVGKRLQVTATASTSAGDSVAGKVPTWTSSAPAIASVSGTGEVTAVAAGQATISAAVDGRTGVAQITVLGPGDNVVEETGRSVSDTIGVGGGTLTATGTTGIRYRLTVPAGALRKVTRITMTPVAAINTLPLQLLGAVDFQPSGLQFAKPAILAITAPRPSDTLRVVGFSYEADADSVLPTVAEPDSTGTLNLLVRHFSGIGAGSTSTGGMLTFLGSPGPSGNSQTYINQLVALANQTPRSLSAETAVMDRWMANVIVPLIVAADNDTKLFFAVSEYRWWRSTQLASAFTGADLPGRQLADQALAPQVRAVIGINNQLCTSGRDIDFAAAVLWWQLLADDVGIATAANQLDRRTVLDDLCIQVRINTMDYPDPAIPLQSSTLDVVSGLQFGADPLMLNARFFWTLDLSGSTADGVRNGATDDVGRFQQVVAPSGTSALTVLATVCLAAAEVPYLDVCASRLTSRAFASRVINGDVQIFSQQGLLGIQDVRTITGTLTIGGVTSTDLSELAGLQEVGARLEIRDSPNLRTLRGLSSIRRIGAITLQENGALEDLDGLESIQSVSALNLVVNPNLRSVAGLVGLSAAPEVRLIGSPLVTSLQALRGTAITKDLNIQSMDGLTSLADLTGLASAMGTIIITDDPLLADLAALQPVTSASGILVSNTAVAGTADLANLRSVDGINISGTQLSSVVLPALGRITGGMSMAGSLSPSVTRYDLPALTSAGSLAISPGCNGPTVAFNFPALQTIGDRLNLVNSNPSAACAYTVFVPNLRSTGGLLVSGPGLRDLTITSLRTSALGVQVAGTDLRTLQLPQLNTQSVSITDNLLLTSLTMSGTVSGGVTVSGNKALSQAAATATVNNMTVGGPKVVGNNKDP